MKKYKGIIFDLDGTLVNTLEDLADSVNDALTAMGYPTWQVDDYRMKVGRGFRNLMENSVPADRREDSAVIDEMLTHFVAAYEEYGRKRDNVSEHGGVYACQLRIQPFCYIQKIADEEG